MIYTAINDAGSRAIFQACEIALTHALDGVYPEWELTSMAISRDPDPRDMQPMVEIRLKLKPDMRYANRKSRW